MVHIFHTDGASSVSSDEGGVRRVFGSNPGSLIRQQAAVHYKVSGLIDRHPGGWPESGDRKSEPQPGLTRTLPQGPGISNH